MRYKETRGINKMFKSELVSLILDPISDNYWEVIDS